ncbi:hypothetical protein [Cellulomonas wangsupingiae]|uniref:Uncharacterized protein n=1 Tax=Cellulomonas wangsupingiae TaxID=2968085 RepID=A0ABY5K209_9CELL|nr:hypothetical protein [Cellulomonas wangsupingiae]MCC2336682.1 hypothetical protein [Cellulomonas wangsupingiae]UUI63828.1 hypothetical protein NP075_11840 [Cellulomonas wangsupingiae]
MTSQDAADARDVVGVLRRWEDSGAVWRVLGADGERLVVGLWTCTGGEVVERVESDDPALARFVAGRASSEEPVPDVGPGTAAARPDAPR